jgi:membrane protease YdiL (CAAX protease family)
VTDWTAFAGFTGVVLSLLLVLAHASKGHLSPRVDAKRASEWSADGDKSEDAFDGEPDDAFDGEPDDTFDGEPDDTFDGDTFDDRARRIGHVDHADADASDADADDADSRPDTSDGASRPDPPAFGRPTIADVSPVVLLVNVAISQGLFAGMLVVGAWVTEVPPSAFGIDGVTPALVGLGVGLGGVLYVANEIGSAVGERVGLGGEEALREALAPKTRRGWVLLLFVVLPIIAGFEELLFRGALVGAFAVGFGVSPWALAALSSVAFALGHGAQGVGGVVVTGILGFALAAAFVLTGSLLVVFVAHYLVNALSFVVHEGFDVDPLG